MKTTFLISIILLIISTTYGQNTLTITDENNEPIEGAIVYPTDRAFLLVSNRNGIVNLSQFNYIDTDSLCIRHIQYNSACVAFASLANSNFTLVLKSSTVSLEEVVFAAQKWGKDKEHVAQQITRITPKQISFNNPQTSADLLGSTGEVFIQKSQMGGGSPMIRGFAANRVLLVVDGVRMNNPIYRSGNLQNIISIDPNALQNAEVVFGPGSVLYGSDALGGVMNFSTLEPTLNHSEKFMLEGSGMMRYASANHEKTGHFDLSYGTDRWAAITSFTYSDFDDLRAGANRPEDYPDFGKRLFYVERRKGEDVVVRNENVNIQRFSGYNQWNFLQKFRYAFTNKLKATYSFHYTSSTDIPRYDRLIEYRNGQLRNAEWYYGPQEWQMHHIQLDWSPENALADYVKIIGAWQQVEESRHDRRLGSNRLRSRTENVDVLSFNIDAIKNKKENTQQLSYGVELTHNIVNSKGLITDIITNEQFPTSSRYPSEGSTVTTLSAYAGYEWFLSEKTTLTSGARYSHIVLTSNFTDKRFFDFPFDEANINTGAINGSLGFTYRPQKGTQWNLHLSTGFRAPNVDDVGKLFDSEPGSVVVPNPNVRPEYAWNAEAGFKHAFGDILKVETTAWYTLLTNALVRRPFMFSGQDSIMYDGTLSQVDAIVNTGRAITTGVTGNVLFAFAPKISLQSALTYTYGRDIEEDLPLRHVPPLFGETALRWDTRKWQLEAEVVYQGWKRWEDLAPSEQAKVFSYTEDGTPAWYTLNLRGSINLTNQITVQAALENILDRHYRPYSSGISASGRNVVLSIRGYF